MILLYTAADKRKTSKPWATPAHPPPAHLAYVLEHLLVPLAVPQRPVHPNVFHLVHRRLGAARHRQSDTGSGGKSATPNGGTDNDAPKQYNTTAEQHETRRQRRADAHEDMTTAAAAAAAAVAATTATAQVSFHPGLNFDSRTKQRNLSCLLCFCLSPLAHLLGDLNEVAALSPRERARRVWAALDILRPLGKGGLELVRVDGNDVRERKVALLRHPARPRGDTRAGGGGHFRRFRTTTLHRLCYPRRIY